MEAVIFTGLQAAGKSSFYRERLFATHLRVNLDQLKTRHRERRLVELCLETGLKFVVDNTNPTRAERAVYIQAAKAAGFRVAGYYFASRVADCLARNAERPPAERVPEAGVLGAAGRLERPNLAEGFDSLFYVRLTEAGFTVEAWADEL